jgi:hypothetical protein
MPPLGPLDLGPVLPDADLAVVEAVANVVVESPIERQSARLDPEWLRAVTLPQRRNPDVVTVAARRPPAEREG